MSVRAWHIFVALPLFFAGCSDTAGGVDIWDAVNRNDAAQIAKYAGAGGDVNVRDWGGNTPLWIALDADKRESYEALLKNGADPNIILSGQRTVIHWAASNDGESWWLKLALENGGDPNLLNTGHGSPLEAPPLHFAIANRARVQETAGSVERVKLLVEHGADVNKVDDKNCDPLAYAATQGRLKIVLFLLDHGANFVDLQWDGVSFVREMKNAYEKKDFLYRTAERREEFSDIRAWLEKHGVDLSIPDDAAR